MSTNPVIGGRLSSASVSGSISGGKFKALSGTVNATGHITAFEEHAVTIPSSAASANSAGLMSASDKSKLDSMSQTRIHDGSLEYYSNGSWTPHNIAGQLIESLSALSVGWELGAIASASGNNSTSSTRIRTATYIPTSIFGINVASGYRYVLLAYRNGTYAGAWNKTTFTTTATWLTEYVDLTALPGYRFRIVLARNPDSGTMSVSESENIVFDTKTSLSSIVTRILNLEQAIYGLNPSDPQGDLYNVMLRLTALESTALQGDEIST